MMFGEIAILLQSYHQECSMAESYACISSVPAQISVIANENLTVMLFNINHIVTTCSSSCSFHTRLIHNLLEIIARKM